MIFDNIKPYPREAMQKAIENAEELFFLSLNRKELIQKLTRSCSQLEFLLRQTNLDLYSIYFSTSVQDVLSDKLE